MKKIKLTQAPGGPPGDDIYTVVEKINDNFMMVGSESLTLDDLGVTVASLNGGGTVPSHQLPSYVDDVLEFATLGDFPNPGEDGKIYVSLDENLTYRWTGTQYVEISKSIELGNSATTAFRGDHGKAAYDHSQVTSGNPHNVTAADVGAPTLADLSGHESDTNNPHEVTAAQVGAVTTGDFSNHVTDTNNPHEVTAADVGAATVGALGDHISDDNNPHGVTASQAEAIPEDLSTLDQLPGDFEDQDIVVVGRGTGAYQTTRETFAEGILEQLLLTGSVIACSGHVEDDGTINNTGILDVTAVKNDDGDFTLTPPTDTQFNSLHVSTEAGIVSTSLDGNVIITDSDGAGVDTGFTFISTLIPS